MPSQLENLPLRASLGKVGPRGDLITSREWLAAFSRIDTLLRNTSESWTTDNRPTKGLYPGRGGYNTSDSLLDVWSGSAWIQLESSASLSDLNAIKQSFNGTIIETIRIVVASNGTTWTLALDQSGGGSLNCFFAGTQVPFDTEPAASVNLTAGTDSIPKVNYVYLTESGGTVTMAANTTGWPNEPVCHVATVLLQSAASGATDAALKVHAWTDHVKTNEGHVVHIGEKLRSQHATWASGVAGANMVVSSPDAYLSVSAGVIFQLHMHDFPALDMQTGDPIWIANDPTTAFKRITTLDDVTQDAIGGSIDNRHFPLVLWGVVNETTSESKFFINLPTGSYTTSVKAILDANRYAVFSFPSEFTGTAFLIAKYTAHGRASGAWVQDAKVDLRGLLPTGSPTGAGITDHSDLAGLTDDDHTQYLLADGTRTAEYIQLNTSLANGTVEGRLQWNSEDGTLEYGLPGGNVTLQVGQEQLVKCVNKTGITITDGEVVYISGASGSRPEISPADASDAAKSFPLGLATEDITNNNQGYVNVGGLVRGIDTSGIAAGGFGYLDESTPGALRATAPAFPNHSVIVGSCVVSSAGSGIFLVRVHDDHTKFTLDANTDISGNAWFLDEDDFASDDATKAVSQQSAKAYIATQVGGGGGLVPLTSITASNDATIDFTGIDGTYKPYRLIGSGVVPATDGTGARIRISIAASFKSGGTDYRWNGFRYVTTVSPTVDASDAEIQFGDLVVGSAAGENLSFEVNLPDPANTALYKLLHCTGDFIRSDGSLSGFTISGNYKAGTQAIDGIQFSFLTGNVESGEFTLYGLASA